MLGLVILVSLVQQLPPDPAALPPRMPLITQVRTPEQIERATYREFLQAPAAERQARFASLPAADRSVIVRHHLERILETERLTIAERRVLRELSNAATPAAYAGDPGALKTLAEAEARMIATLSERPLRAYRELLSPTGIPEKIRERMSGLRLTRAQPFVDNASDLMTKDDVERIARRALKDMGAQSEVTVTAVSGRDGQFRIDVPGSAAPILITCGQGTSPQWVREQICEKYSGQP